MEGGDAQGHLSVVVAATKARIATMMERPVPGAVRMDQVHPTPNHMREGNGHAGEEAS